MRILSWNLLRNDGAGVADLAALIRTHDPDLVLMQEAIAAIEALPDRLGGHFVRRSMVGRRHGLAAWSPRSFRTEIVPLPLAPRLDLPPAILRTIAPRLALVVVLDAIEIATVHLDHGQIVNRRQLRALLAARPGLSSVIGDFNAFGPASLPGFFDVGPRAATFRAGFGLLPLRLDRCLARGLRCRGAVALDRGRSDHRPILLDLERRRA